MYIAKKGRITLTFEETLQRIEDKENFDVAPLEVDVLKIADQIELVMEMHDRLIVATALHFNASLITKDQFIRDSGICATIW